MVLGIQRLTLSALLALPSSAGSQEPPPMVVGVSAELVQVDAVVTDKKGRYVTDLQAEDFEIFADGKKRTITNFRYVTLESRPAPTSLSSEAASASLETPQRPAAPSRSLAIVIDDLSLSFESTIRTRSALNRLVDEQLGPGD